MVHDDDTGRPPNFEIEPSWEEGPRQATPTSAVQRQIVELAQQHGEWSASEMARYLSKSTNQKVTADNVTWVLQRAQRGSKDRG
jgi:hypothetical protein